MIGRLILLALLVSLAIGLVWVLLALNGLQVLIVIGALGASFWLGRITG